MTKKASDKIIDSLTQLIEGYAELQESLENKLGAPEEEETVEEGETGHITSEVETALIKEMKVAIETALEAEDYAPEEVAAMISTMTDALEEIDPNIFEDEDEDLDEDDEDDDETYNEDEEELEDEDLDEDEDDDDY